MDNFSYKSILKLSFPIFLVSLIRALIDVIIMIICRLNCHGYMGNVVILGLVTPIFMIVNAIGLGILSSFTITLSKKDNKLLLFILSFAFSLIIFIILNTLSYNLTSILNIKSNLKENASRFIKLKSYEVVNIFMVYYYSSICNSNNKPFKVVIYMMIYAITSLYLSYVLSYYYHTIYAIQASFSFVSLLSSFYLLSKISPYFGGIKATLNETLKVILNTFKIILGQVITQLGFIVINIIILKFDNSSITSYTIATKINALFMAFALSLGSVVNVMLSKNIGSNRLDKERELTKKIVVVTIISSIILGLILFTSSKMLLKVFCQNDQTLNLANNFCKIIALSLTVLALFQVYLSILETKGHLSLSIILQLIRQWIIRIPLIVIFIKIIGLQNEILWYTLPIANLIPLILGIIIYKNKRKQEN